MIAAAAAGAIFYFNRGSQIRIEGSMKKVRMQKLYENSTLLVFDFRFSNPANFPFVVAEVTSECTLADGRKLEGELVTDADAKPIFAFHALTLGDKYNESLIRKSRVAPKTTEDRMIRINRGQLRIVKTSTILPTMTTYGSPGLFGKTVKNTMPPSSIGMAMKISPNREKNESTQPAR